MKNFNLKCLTLVLLCLTINSLKAQFYFGVTPGLQLNGAVFGYQANKFVPYISFQMMGGGVNYKETGKRHDAMTGDIVDYTDIYKASGTIYIPAIGCKYFFMETNKLKAYGNLSISKLFISAKVEDSDNPNASEDLKEALDNTKITGGQLGFGVEYFFDDNFSIGGEFGLRLIHANFKEESEETITDFNTGDKINYKRVNTSIMNFNPSYAKLSLNFYFGK